MPMIENLALNIRELTLTSLFSHRADPHCPLIIGVDPITILRKPQPLGNNKITAETRLIFCTTRSSLDKKKSL